MKKIYTAPLVEVIEIKTSSQLLQGSRLVDTMGGDSNPFKDVLGGSSDGGGRSREDDFDEDEDF